MSKRLIEALSRAGVVELYELAGRDAVDLLQRIESRTLSANGLATIVVDRFGASQVLCNHRMREVVLTALRKDEAAALCGILGLVGEDHYHLLIQTDFNRSESLLESMRPASAVSSKTDGPPGSD